ncbi:hypothetical protein DRO26_01025, partial [Candidatus Bathyarchaeota archaeon]
YNCTLKPVVDFFINLLNLNQNQVKKQTEETVRTFKTQTETMVETHKEAWNELVENAEVSKVKWSTILDEWEAETEEHLTDFNNLWNIKLTETENLTNQHLKNILKSMEEQTGKLKNEIEQTSGRIGFAVSFPSGGGYAVSGYTLKEYITSLEKSIQIAKEAYGWSETHPAIQAYREKISLLKEVVPLQKGGIVRKETLAYLHPQEAVIPLTVLREVIRETIHEKPTTIHITQNISRIETPAEEIRLAKRVGLAVIEALNRRRGPL